MRVLIDTCVILDVLQSREPFFRQGEQIFLAAANRRFSGFLTAKALTDLYYILHKHTHSDSAARKTLEILLLLFDLLDTAGADCKLALASGLADFEDAVMVESAVRERMEGIVTRNLRDYAKAGLPVYSPGEFLEKMNAEM